MIIDTLGQASRYGALHPGLAKALEHLVRANVADLAMGEHELEGRRLYMIAAEDPGRTREGARLEAHRRYIDIQIVVSGTEVIGWRRLEECEGVGEAYDAEKDIGFFTDEPTAWLELSPGTFAIFFPDDAHAPLAGEGLGRKVVVKVAADW